VTAPLLRLASLAWRESRSARRRLLVSMSSIALGVAALVAIDSFAGNVTRSVHEQSRTILGGDVQVTAHRPLPAPVERWLDSLASRGVPNARLVSFPATATTPRTGGTRLVQVRGVGAGYPWYGRITTAPADQYTRLQTSPVVLVDPALLIATGARVGDTLTLGKGHFQIAGTLEDVPGTTEFSAALGPRVYVGQRYLASTQLLGFGATADYSAVLRLPRNTDPTRFVAPVKQTFNAQQIQTRTVTQTEQSTTNATNTLASFIGVVGLVALLLGGIGVASGIRAFVARKIDTVAILRCLGATAAQVLVIYVAQAAVMGLIGAAIGALLGVAVQFALPALVHGLIPVDVTPSIEPAAVLSGLAVGGWLALIFALRPLLALRTISPLQTLRRESDATVLRREVRDWRQLLVTIALIVSVVAVAMARADTPIQGLWIAAATAAVVGFLALSAELLTRIARRVLREGWPYVVRQGVANVYRPANQTRAVILSLGFGAFLLATLYLVQTNLLKTFALDATVTGANVLFFDVQDDQVTAVDSLVRAHGFRVVQRDATVPMRISAINGVPVAELARDTLGRQRREGWALRREYRSTFRDSLLGGERLRSGKFFDPHRTIAPADTGEVSIDVGLADNLRIALGDVITWDVQGVPIPTRVTSLREVTWMRFEPNFFAVFQPSVLRDAPKQYIVLADVPGPKNVAAIQRDVVHRFPNISAIDLALILSTVQRIVDRVTTAIRFMALFSVAIGIPVLFSAVAATRRDRIREGVLLKTLGATRAQIIRILVTEYALLGTLGSATGVLLALGGASALLHRVFKQPNFSIAVTPLVTMTVGMIALTVGIGVLAGRDVFRETAMAALRDGG